MLTRTGTRHASRKHLACAIALTLFAVVRQADCGTPPAAPFPRIETGTHGAAIRAIDVDAGGRLLVSASDDKTVRVWALPDGNPLQVLRPPIGEGNEGKLYAVALSRDGTQVATSGWTGSEWDHTYSIYLFDPRSGRLTRRIGGLPDRIHHLAFDSEGGLLAASLGGHNGIRVFRTSDGREVFRDGGYGRYSYWVEFDARGRLVAASDDGVLRLYGSDFTLQAQGTTGGGKKIAAARFSPDGSRIAVAFFEEPPVVNVLSGDDLHLLYAPDTGGPGHGDLHAVAWSRTGDRLYAAGEYTEADGTSPILMWLDAGRGPRTSLRAANNTVEELQALPNGGVAFGVADSMWGTYDASQNSLFVHCSRIPDLRIDQQRFRVSHDGSTVEFDLQESCASDWKRRLVRLDASAAHVTLDANAQPGLTSPRTTGLDIQDWYDTTRPRLGTTPLGLSFEERSRSLAIADDGQRFVLGSDWNLRCFDRLGRERWKTSTPGIAWAVNLTPDGSRVVAALGDGSIRWYSATTGKEKLAFFITTHTWDAEKARGAQDTQWVLWTPEGYYETSDPGADSLIGYHLNRGASHEGEFITAGQLSKQFYRPDLLAQRATGAREDGGLRLAGIDHPPDVIGAAVPREGNVGTVLAKGLPPAVDLLSPANVTLPTDEFELRFAVRDQGGGIGRITYLVDGVPLEGRPVGIGLPGQAVGRRFPLSPGPHLVQVEVANSRGVVSQRVGTQVTTPPAQEERPTLYVLAMGVTKYRDSGLLGGVKYAASDARDVAEELKTAGVGLFKDLVVRSLLDDDVVIAKITETFKELAQRIKPTDVFVLYAAGHGAAQNGEYFFVPADLDYENDEALAARSLSGTRLQELVATIPATKTLVILDTCSSGTFADQPATRDAGEKAAIARLMRATNRTILASAAHDDVAIEGYHGHGVFTYALLDGLQGKADSNRDHTVEVDELAAYLSNIVPEITEQNWHIRQVPMRWEKGDTFALARTAIGP
jgi:WD40 repeat protein